MSISCDNEIEDERYRNDFGDSEDDGDVDRTESNAFSKNECREIKNEDEDADEQLRQTRINLRNFVKA